MEIHINTGNGMENKAALEAWADGEIRSTLGRFSNDVRRIEVHLSDDNSAKGGAGDKRCMIEAHVTGRPAVAVTHQASSMDEAFRGAEAKARRALDSAIGKLSDRRDHTTIRTGPDAD
ncbi:HPF/RaiA family ribosome-associated protein [Variovorax sp. ZT4R33]|uniref:HPF/RaiA family ribosome-associated protein n=1 Tax=Variovorax sp. ZT4R33 TaxID=3443743 RepID=UPI003F4537A2